MAANIAFLTEDILYEMRGSPTEHCRELLADCLKWSHFLADEHEHMQQVVIFDILWDHICFSLRNRFSLGAVKRIAVFINNILLVLPGSNITDVLSAFYNELNALSTLATEQQLKCYAEFFNDKISKQFRLIQFVMTHSRDVDCTTLDLCLNVPSRVIPLNESKKLSVWNRDRALERIEKEEALKAEQRENLKFAFDGEKRMLLEDLRKNDCTTVQTPTEEEVEKIIKKVTKLHMEAISSTLKIDVEDMTDKVKYQAIKSQHLSRPDVDGSIG